MRRFALLALLLCCACVPESGNGGNVLRLSNWGGAGDAETDFDKLVQQLYVRFEEENRGVDVRVEGIPGEYMQKMLLNHVAGTMPDVMQLDASSAAVFINNGILMDLTPFIERDKAFRLADYFPNVVSIGRREKGIYAVPIDFTPMVVYYNKRMFDKAGVPYPKPGWTFDDFLQAAKRLTIRGRDGKVQQYGFAFANWMPGWVMWLWNGGGDVLSPDKTRASGVLDSPQNVRTVEFLRDLVNVHRVSPSLSEAASQGVDPFANGQAAMAVAGHWALIAYKSAPKDVQGRPKIDWRELGVVEMPRLRRDQPSRTVMYQAGLAIPKGAKNPELAWRFLKFWTSYRIQREYNSSGIAVSARKDVAAERATEPIEQQFLEVVPTARPPYGSRVEGYELVERLGQNALASVLNDNVPVEQALRQAALRIDTEFAKR